MKRLSGLALALVGVALAAGPAGAADHRDSPSVTADPGSDITDIYTWVPSAGKVALVMDVHPAAAKTDTFSNAVDYVFHVNAYDKFGGTAGAEIPVICQFDAGTPQQVSCWLGDTDYVTGDASSTSGLTSKNGSFKVFTGPRDDPFFFNLTGFKNAVAAVDAAEGGLIYDMAGCPMVDAATASALGTMLKSGPNGTTDPPMDDFAGTNVLSIVIEADASAFTGAGPVLAVWGSTNKR